jgi:ADP-heptose:LPS heptosyltransferase
MTGGRANVFEAVLPGKLRKSRNLIDQADAARDARQYGRAALLYERHLQGARDDAAIHIQCGHMFKEAGDFIRAEHHYDCAKTLTPDDADLALQLGHFYKVSGRLADAELAYRRAIDLAGDWPEPAIQLAQLYRQGWRDHTIPLPGERGNGAASPAESGLTPPEIIDGDAAADRWLIPKIDELLLPELAPQPPEDQLRGHGEEIKIWWFGHFGRTAWGMRDVVRGVEAIRGYCISATPIVEVRACLNGLRFRSETPKPYPLKYEKYNPRLRKYVFNIWYDFSHFREGAYEGQLYFVDAAGGMRSYTRQIVVAPPLSEEDYPASDRLVDAQPGDDRPLVEQINAKPSMIRPAYRSPFATPPKNVLIVRVDQLGDVVVSIAALRRLRELLPAARIVGLLSPANADLAATLELFDEIVTVDFTEDAWQRRRIMSLDKQHELTRRLRQYNFDVAIDLAEAFLSRPLLLLSGAPFRYGFWAPESPWLTAHFEGWHIDPVNGTQVVPIADKTLGLIEWFGVLFGHHAPTVRRDDLRRDRLVPYGLAPSDRFVVLHTGARLVFSQWPHYQTLAAMLLERTDLKVVMMTDDRLMRARLAPPLLAAQERFQLIDRRLPFDDFDAFLSFCEVLVGNDSGPAHLAALRGRPVISLFMARHNWNEWGHENHGYIISRRVPCAGCVIHDDPEECGKDFACITNIAPEEVFATLLKCL